MAAILTLLNGFIVGMVVFGFFSGAFGNNNPLTRLINLLLGLGSGIGYFLLCVQVNYGELSMKIGMVTGGIILFGPIALVLILMLLGYMFKDN